MISWRVKVAAALSVAAAIIVTAILLLAQSGTESSRAERIVLTDGSLNPDWAGMRDPSYSNLGGMRGGLDSMAAFALSNATDSLDVNVFVYDSSHEAMTAFEFIRESYMPNSEAVNFTTFQAGDAGFLVWTNSNSTGHYPSVWFVKGDVLCSIWYNPDQGNGPYGPHPWNLDTVRYLAQEQESKIESAAL